MPSEVLITTSKYIMETAPTQSQNCIINNLNRPEISIFEGGTPRRYTFHVTPASNFQIWWLWPWRHHSDSVVMVLRDWGSTQHVCRSGLCYFASYSTVACRMIFPMFLGNITNWDSLRDSAPSPKTEATVTPSRHAVLTMLKIGDIQLSNCTF